MNNLCDEFEAFENEVYAKIKVALWAELILGFDFLEEIKWSYWS